MEGHLKLGKSNNQNSFSVFIYINIFFIFKVVLFHIICLLTAFLSYSQGKLSIFYGTIFLRDPPCKDGNVRFTTVPLIKNLKARYTSGFLNGKMFAFISNSYLKRQFVPLYRCTVVPLWIEHCHIYREGQVKLHLQPI